MKKIGLLVSIVLIIAIFFCSCSANSEIKSVVIDDVEYKTIYLYSFKNAQIDKYVKTLQTEVEPTESGFVYSSGKLSPGDTVKVWSNSFFNEDISNSSGNFAVTDSDFGTIAVVDKVMETYCVEIKSTNSTYRITYYTYSGETVSEKKNIEEIEKHNIEVTKERVTIKYE